MAKPNVDQPYATLPELQDWAHGIMLSRQQDEIIGGDYMRRWFITPRSPHQNVYLHEILRSDDDRALHDHPWDNTSIIISGSYIENTPYRSEIRTPGDAVWRPAAQLHRLELINDEPVVSLFITGPKVREWGFDCPQGWVHWRDFEAVASLPVLNSRRVA